MLFAADASSVCADVLSVVWSMVARWLRYWTIDQKVATVAPPSKALNPLDKSAPLNDLTVWSHSIDFMFYDIYCYFYNR